MVRKKYCISLDKRIKDEATRYLKKQLISFSFFIEKSLMEYTQEMKKEEMKLKSGNKLA